MYSLAIGSSTSTARGSLPGDREREATRADHVDVGNDLRSSVNDNVSSGV